jgi:RNA polymerase sigma-70 factor (ECF subfamily)
VIADDRRAHSEAKAGRMTFREVYDNHVRFVWRALLRLGVPERDVPDAVQDVFVVVHRRLSEFEGRSKISTWLFGISMRVAADRRRVAHARWERIDSEMLPSVGAKDPDAVALLERRRAREMLGDILDRMPEEQRIAFVLFELEGMSGDEIAELLEVSVGTVRSRLRLAREVFQEAVARVRARERRHEGFLPVSREALR